MADQNHCYLHGIGLSGYRSFGPELQRIGPFRKINLLMGQNNSGKSNILRLVHGHYGSLLRSVRQNNQLELDALDRFRTQAPFDPAFALALRFMKSSGGPKLRNGETVTAVLKRLMEISAPAVDGIYWLDFSLPTNGLLSWSKELLNGITNTKAHEVLREINFALRNTASQNPAENAAAAVKWLVTESISEIPTAFIPAIRRPGSAQLKTNDYSGDDIIHRIAKIQNPQHDNQELKEDFRKIEHFLQEVTDRPEARLEIPYDRDSIIVHMNGRSLPLASLGTGIHEVIILAAAATTLHGHMVCIEEPELHLHPILQRKLLTYLDERTDNQYLNRIYLREWIRLKNPALIEGIDYSIMFYGGRLLNHLSPEDPRRISRVQ